MAASGISGSDDENIPRDVSNYRVHRMRSIPSPGNALTEYAFIGGLITATAIVTVLSLGINLDSTLGGLENDLKSHIGASETASVTAPPASAPSVTPSPPAPPVPASSVPTEQICFQGYGCVDMPLIDANAAVNTVGGMGSDYTMAMVTTLRQLAQRITASGGDQYLVNLITQMADGGHAMGFKEADIEKLCTTPPSCILGGADAETYHTLYWELYHSSSGFSSAKYELLDYLEANPAALPPAMQELIRIEAMQIHNIQLGFHGAPDQNGVTQIYDGSKLTHQSSNSICSTGGHGCMHPL